jgi:hypothetical protein
MLPCCKCLDRICWITKHLIDHWESFSFDSKLMYRDSLYCT